jgi:membrane protein
MGETVLKFIAPIQKFINEWMLADPFTHSAAVAYYTLFSFPPLIIVLISMSSFFFSGGQFEAEVYNYLAGIMGQSSAEYFQETVARSALSQSSGLMLLVGIGLLLVTSLRLFLQLQNGLNSIWSVDISQDNYKDLIRRRLVSFAIILAIGFTLLASLLLTTVLSALSGWLSRYMSDTMLQLFHVLDFLLSIATITALFTLMLKALPDRKVSWTSAFYGALVATVLFQFGEYALSYYFEYFDPESAYGVAGSIVLLLIWVSYSANILFLGAQVSKNYQLPKRVREKEQHQPNLAQKKPAF